MKLIFLLALLCAGSSLVLAEINRCGNIPDDRSVYTNYFDSSNGHDILQIVLTVNPTSNYTWADIVADQDKWDDFKPVATGTVTIGNGSPMACTMERRGDWSAESPLPSLKVKFTASGAEYKGMSNLLLNKHPWDTTRLRNKLTYELLQSVTNMGSQFTQFAQMTAAGQPYGLYTLLEDISDNMMKTHGLGSNSYLYKSNDVSWNLNKDKGVKEVTDKGYSKKDFEDNWDIRGADDHRALISAYEHVFDSNISNRAAMENSFNIDNFATWLAVQFLDGQKDMIFNNYGVYAPKESKSCAFPPPFYMMAWDNDGAWDNHYLTQTPGTDFPRFYAGIQYFWRIRIVRRFLQVPIYVDLLKQKMETLVNGVMSQNNILTLTNQFKTIVRPILEQEPDLSHLAGSSNIDDWASAVDLLAAYPTTQYQNFAETANYPMPFKQDSEFSTDGTSFFFYWDLSYILYNKPVYYDFYISHDQSFDNSTTPFVYYASTKLNYIAVPTDSLQANTFYYWRVVARNPEDPTKYFQYSYQSISSSSGFGTSNFTTPASLPASPAAQTATISNVFTYTDPNGTAWKYATLDNIDPSTDTLACTNASFAVPDGWVVAPNNNLVMSHIAAINKRWGGSNLICRDGAALDPSTGKRLDGFGTYNVHLFATAAADGTQMYFPQCTSTHNSRILLADPATLDSVDQDAEPSLPTTGAASALTTSLALMIAYVIVALMV